MVPRGRPLAPRGRVQIDGELDEFTVPHAIVELRDPNGPPRRGESPQTTKDRKLWDVMEQTAPMIKPSVLFVYYTYTQQTLKLVDAMADVLRDRECDVHLGAIEFVDARYA